MFCTRCGEEIEPSSKFCTACGEPVGQTEVVPKTEELPEDPSAAPGQFLVGVGNQAANAVRGGQQAASQSGIEQPRKSNTTVIVVAIIAAAAVIIVAILAFVFLSKGSSGNDADASAGQQQTQQQEQQDQQEASSQGSSSSQQQAQSGSEPDPDPEYTYTGMTHATATSYLPTGGINAKDYSPANVLDGNTATVWSEGDSGNGVGQSITLAADTTQKISGFRIYAGYQESDYLYDINTRPKDIKVTSAEGATATMTLKDAGRTYQEFVFDTPLITSEITFEILSVYPGSKYADCCISEITCY